MNLKPQSILRGRLGSVISSLSGGEIAGLVEERRAPLDDEGADGVRALVESDP